MAQDALTGRLKNHEDNFVERKPDGVNASEIRQTITAFANSVPPDSSGVLFIGVHNDGKIQGVENPDKLQKTVREQCERVCYPPIAFASEVLNVDGKPVLAVVVAHSKNRPHFSGPAFVRRGSESVAASLELFEELIASRNDKVAAILRMRGGPITVICVQHKLGSTEHIADQRYRTRSDCVVQSCDAHTLRMRDTGSDRNITEPLELVTVSYDEERHRPMLVIKGQ
ncbi:MAG TPA: ATP-binding protein [Burkholderiales bacterium]|nr:ATP-binding protein [Burkholderiales bacterium]